MKLIENWRKAHKLSSMQLMAIAAAVEAVNGVLDGVIPAWVSVSLILLAMVARVVAQDSVKCASQPNYGFTSVRWLLHLALAMDTAIMLHL